MRVFRVVFCIIIVVVMVVGMLIPMRVVMLVMVVMVFPCMLVRCFNLLRLQRNDPPTAAPAAMNGFAGLQRNEYRPIERRAGAP